jgi:hypothetical protein
VRVFTPKKSRDGCIFNYRNSHVLRCTALYRAHRPHVGIPFSDKDLRPSLSWAFQNIAMKPHTTLNSLLLPESIFLNMILFQFVLLRISFIAQDVAEIWHLVYYFTAIGSTESADEKFPVWYVFGRIPEISVSFAPIQMKPSQIFQANSYAISDREKLAKILYIDWPVITDCFRDKWCLA